MRCAPFLLVLACGTRTALDTPPAAEASVPTCKPMRYDVTVAVLGPSSGFALDDDSIFVTSPTALVRLDKETGASTTIADGELDDVTVDASFVYVMHEGTVSKLPKSGGPATDLGSVSSGFFVGQTDAKLLIAKGNAIVAIPKDGGASSLVMAPSATPLTAIVAAASDPSRLFWSSGVALYTVPLDATNADPTCYGDFPSDSGFALALDDDTFVWASGTTLMRMSKGGGSATFYDAGLRPPLAASHGAVYGQSAGGIARFVGGATTTIAPEAPQRLVIDGACLYASVAGDGGVSLERIPN